MSQNQNWQEKKVTLGGSIIAVFVALILGGLVGNNWHSLVNNFGMYLGGRTPASPLDYSSLDEVYRTLRYHYDGEIDTKLLLEGAKRGMAASLGDRYTVFMNASEAADFNNSLSGDVGAGIGVEMGQRDGFVKVLRTLPDNPARRSGMLAGDVIYKVNGEEVYSLEPEEIATKIRGEVGTEVTVTVVRGKEELDFTMTREKINNISVYVDYIGNVAIMTISRFDRDTSNLAREIADEINRRGIDRIIVDLRGNGGGYVDAAQGVLGLWIDGELVMEQRSSTGFSDERYYAKSGAAILAGKRTVVLINGSSASAAEIMAGALRDYEKATLIGEKSFGKGSVQILADISGGAKIKITIARWYTPKGYNINGEGIKPDIEVERSFDDINHELDPQLDRAMQFLYE